MPTPEDWLDKHYPVPASEAATDALTAIKHSRQKWEGLRPEVLEEHGLVQNEHRIFKKGNWFNTVLRVTDVTCSLCQLNDAHYSGDADCYHYPVTRLHGKSCHAEYREFVQRSDPEPMIALLKQCEEEELKCPTRL